MVLDATVRQSELQGIFTVLSNPILSPEVHTLQTKLDIEKQRSRIILAETDKLRAQNNHLRAAYNHGTDPSSTGSQVLIEPLNADVEPDTLIQSTIRRFLRSAMNRLTFVSFNAFVKTLRDVVSTLDVDVDAILKEMEAESPTT
jgi:hypothetical protein